MANYTIHVKNDRNFSIHGAKIMILQIGDFLIFKADSPKTITMPFLETDKVKLHYYEFGHGDQIMLAFHGFGMRGTQFNVLEPALRSRFKVYSFDLFFHGQTVLRNEHISNIRAGCSAADIAKMITVFLKDIDAEGKKVSLLSYSMGALLCWALIQEMPEKINSVFFVAPDGIKPNRLLSIGARNKLVNRIFWKLVYSPKTVDFVLNNLLKFRYVDQSLYTILKQEFGTTETRLACYNAITYNAQLIFNSQALVRLLNENRIESHFYFGKKDKLFPATMGERFAKQLDRTNLHIFEGGHELVNEELNELLETQLKQMSKND